MGKARVVAAAARRHGVRPGVLWGIFGAESSWGKAGNWFGLVAVPRTGSFAGDANAAARTLSRLLKRTGGNYEHALRLYSGGGYGLGHVHQLNGIKPLPNVGRLQRSVPTPRSARSSAATSTSSGLGVAPNRAALIGQLFASHRDNSLFGFGPSKLPQATQPADPIAFLAAARVRGSSHDLPTLHMKRLLDKYGRPR